MTATLTFVSLMAPNADAGYRALAEYLTARGLPTRVDEAQPWEERERMLARGAADFGAVCGAVYARLHDRPEPAVRLLAAPVQRPARYADRPVYFSDLVVRADARFASLEDLRGATWAYNEPRSFSGYYVLCAHLADLGGPQRFFGRIVESGAHLTSIELVLAGQADAAAIDSIVLERACAERPALAERLRVVQTLGPNPTPPLVAARHLAPALAERLRAALLDMQRDPAGQAALRAAGLARFAAVDDAGYAAIRATIRRAQAAPTP